VRARNSVGCKMEKILLGMSGGKDSTWACRVLQSKGYEVEGLLLVLHSSAPVEEARSAAERLGIKLHIADRSSRFKVAVEEYFAKEYLNGRTPNPCVECNSNIKFATLIEEADRLGIEKISTGHYVRVGKSGDRYTLCQGKDLKKDQSYFLWQLTQEVLSRFVSPLEDITKDEVVEGVVGASLVKEIKESQEICFIPDNDYVSFLKRTLLEQEVSKAFATGDFVTSDGKVVGKHSGYASYTVGQRKGLGIALGRPAFVLDILPEENKVLVGFEEDNRCQRFLADSLNFVSAEPFEGELKCFVRPRYRSPLVECEVKVKDGIANVYISTSIKSVSPGQSAVFYDTHGTVLFGGKICKEQKT